MTTKKEKSVYNYFANALVRLMNSQLNLSFSSDLKIKFFLKIFKNVREI